MNILEKFEPWTAFNAANLKSHIFPSHLITFWVFENVITTREPRRISKKSKISVHAILRHCKGTQRRDNFNWHRSKFQTSTWLAKVQWQWPFKAENFQTQLSLLGLIKQEKKIIKFSEVSPVLKDVVIVFLWVINLLYGHFYNLLQLLWSRDGDFLHTCTQFFFFRHWRAAFWLATPYNGRAWYRVPKAISRTKFQDGGRLRGPQYNSKQFLQILPDFQYNHLRKRQHYKYLTSCKMTDSGGAKDRVLQKLESDLSSAEMQWSLFMSALESYRHDSILRPFPSAYVEDGGNKNFKRLVSVY